MAWYQKCHRLTILTSQSLAEFNFKGDIKLQNVTFRYEARPDNPVLQNLNLSVKAGQVVALVGPSGVRACVEVLASDMTGREVDNRLFD